MMKPNNVGLIEIPTDQEMAAMLRTSLSLFTERAFAHLCPGTLYLPNWHIDLIAAKLEAVLDGRITRLIINVPPRSLKSILVSVAFPAWAMGRVPNLKFICASYGMDLATKHAQDCLNLMQAEWYRRLYGNVLVGGRPAVGDFRTVAGGGRLATSVGGVLTGMGGDIIVIDDPLKPDEAVSDTLRNHANAWLDNTVMSRFNDKRTGAMIVIMQRLHMDDLVGHLLQVGEWDVVSLPAIAEVEERHLIESAVYGNKEVFRHAGQALHPEREPIEVLNKLRESQGAYNFAGQYQQSPAPLGGGLIKQEWMRYYEVDKKPAHFQQILQSWDTASKESELADYSVCTTWGIKGADRYLLDVRREKMDFPKLKRAVLEQIERFKPQIVLIEDKASGIQLIQELRSMGHYIVKAVKPEGNKIMRLNAQTAAFEGGFVKLPRSADWLDAYILELTTFPRGFHDDQVDSTSQALAWMATNAVEPGIIGYYRRLAEERGLVPK